ncbi:hypothetical protein LZ30DRAFT_689321 [Colletotrichum cereale]|nr:hypothetical protein LZ30DRAFT_689321 [Colletotrichum cereale]
MVWIQIRKVKAWTLVTRLVKLNFQNEAEAPRFPGQESFQEQMYHSKYHKAAAELPDVEDKNIYDGLKKAGFEIKEVHDGYGLADYQLINGGQYPIDPGANRMIVDGKIKIQRWEEGVKRLSQTA